MLSDKVTDSQVHYAVAGGSFLSPADAGCTRRARAGSHYLLKLIIRGVDVDSSHTSQKDINQQALSNQVPPTSI
jgi:hypothetical protein